jgi:hypothetical protein
MYFLLDLPEKSENLVKRTFGRNSRPFSSIPKVLDKFHVFSDILVIVTKLNKILIRENSWGTEAKGTQVGSVKNIRENLHKSN